LFELKSNAGAKASVHYKTFQVAHESDSYRLTIDDYQTSKAGNAMAEHNDMLFSTYDQDNDLDSADACATFPVAGGGWWFNSCGTATLTARYETASARTAEWKTWTGHEGIDEAEMKIRSQSGTSHSSFVVCISHINRCVARRRIVFPALLDPLHLKP
jgi:hypothetical protein